MQIIVLFRINVVYMTGKYQERYQNLHQAKLSHKIALKMRMNTNDEWKPRVNVLIFASHDVTTHCGEWRRGLVKNYLTLAR